MAVFRVASYQLVERDDFDVLAGVANFLEAAPPAFSSWFDISPFIAPFVECLSPQTRPYRDRVLTQ